MTETLETLETKGGNTIKPPSSKQSNQYMHLCFTWNNYIQQDIETLETLFKHIAHKYCFQEETSESGTPHLQGVVSLKKRMRWSEFGLPSAIHWEMCKNITKAYLYCSKTDTRTGSVFTMNYKLPYVKHIENLFKWQKNICKILSESSVSDRKIYWFWEPEGGVGKTTFQKYIYTHFSDCVVLSGKGSDMKNGVVVYEKKTGNLPKIVLINVPRSIDAGFISYTGIEEVKDMFFFSPKYEGGMVCGENPHVMVFANEPPIKEKMSADRWEISEIVMDEAI